MPDRVNAAVHPMQSPRRRAGADSALVDSQAVQLRGRDDAVLTIRDLGDSRVGCGEFPLHLVGV